MNITLEDIKKILTSEPMPLPPMIVSEETWQYLEKIVVIE